MVITATELRKNMGKYLALAATRDIYIPRNGKSIAKLTSANVDKFALLDSLVGIIPDAETTLDSITELRNASRPT